MSFVTGVGSGGGVLVLVLVLLLSIILVLVLVVGAFCCWYVGADFVLHMDYVYSIISGMPIT